MIPVEGDERGAQAKVGKRPEEDRQASHTRTQRNSLLETRVLPLPQGTVTTNNGGQKERRPTNDAAVTRGSQVISLTHEIASQLLHDGRGQTRLEIDVLLREKQPTEGK